MKQQKTIGGVALRYGSYSLVVTAIVLAVLILVNLAVGLLPASYTTFSVSGQDIYAISDLSRTLMKSVDDKVTLYIVATDSVMDDVVKEYTDRYSDLSSKLSVKTVDPVIYPNFVSGYVDDTFDATATNILVVNEENDRARLILSTDIYYQQYTQEELYYYYSYYGTMPDNPTYFRLENELLSAIDYVTMDQLPTVYYTSGHGEIEIDDTITSLLDEDNIVLNELKLSSVSEIPADTSVILIYAPSMDFTESEITLLRDYADKGGHVILVSYDTPQTVEDDDEEESEGTDSGTADAETDAPEAQTDAETEPVTDTDAATDTASPDTEAPETETPDAVADSDFPNLYGFAAEYGLFHQDALVLEGDSAHYYSYYGPTYIYATLTNNPYASAISGNTYVLMAFAHGLTLDDSISGVTVSKLMTTTTKGYGKVRIDKNTTVEKQEGDLEGQFTLAAKSDKVGSKGTSSLVWFASPLMLDGSTVGQFSNVSYLMAVLTDLCGKEASVTVNSPTLQVEALSVSESAANTWSVILIGVIPAALLLGGFLLWRRRITR